MASVICRFRLSIGQYYGRGYVGLGIIIKLLPVPGELFAFGHMDIPSRKAISQGGLHRSGPQLDVLRAKGCGYIHAEALTGKGCLFRMVPRFREYTRV